jgi:biphenyl-2,3-diol 1,2-dioxygenase
MEPSMIGRMKVAYLVLEVRRPERWREFAAQVLGLPAPAENPDGSWGYRLNGATQALVLKHGRRDDVAALGLELADGSALEELEGRLAASEISAARADRALCRARRVEQLVHFDDPEGTRVEAVVGVEPASGPFRSVCFQGGFGNETGFGHAVLVARDLERMERFYAGTLGFGISERMSARVGPLDVRGVFLHCNRRHHSLALMALPSGKKLQHFMLEAASAVDVVRAYERARSCGVPISLGLGQHPDPDGTFSFYGRTPSEVDFEIGAGGGEIEPRGWRELQTETTSAWGHQPTLGLKLRAARGLIASRLGL